MKKHCYKVIFSKTQQRFIVVSELARSQEKSSVNCRKHSAEDFFDLVFTNPKTSMKRSEQVQNIRKLELGMMQQGIFMLIMTLKIEVHILMIKREIIMTTNIVIRKAIDISKENEIAKFNKLYFIPESNISAISFENTSPNNILLGKISLLNNFLDKDNLLNKKIIFCTCITEQPNTRLINTKEDGNY